MTSKAKKFVAFYLGKAAGNATAAARMAGYLQSDGALRVTASRLLTNANVAAAIQSKLDTIMMSQEEVLLRLSERAASSAEDFVRFDKDGPPESLPKLDLRKARRRGKLGNLKKFKASRRGVDDPLEIVEVEIHDALPALALLAKFHGLDERKAKEPPTIVGAGGKARLNFSAMSDEELESYVAQAG